jgi:hypothetical protein
LSAFGRRRLQDAPICHPWCLDYKINKPVKIIWDEDLANRVIRITAPLGVGPPKHVQRRISD